MVRRLAAVAAIVPFLLLTSCEQKKPSHPAIVQTSIPPPPRAVIPISTPPPAIDPDALIARAIESTVMVIHTDDDDNISFGSGFCTGDSGTIVTNRHVVVDDKTNEPVDCVVCFFAGTARQKLIHVPASNIHLAPASDGNRVNDDLALLKIDGNIVQPLTLGNSDLLKNTQRLHAIGFPDGPEVLTPSPNTLPTPSVLDEVVQRLQNNAANDVSIVQLGGSMTHGDSGGPIVDKDGNVMGICQSVQNDGAIGYAVPSLFVTRFIQQAGPLTGAPTPALTVVGAQQDAADTDQDETKWTTYADDVNGFAIEYPVGWAVTHEARPSDYSFVRISADSVDQSTSVVIEVSKAINPAGARAEWNTMSDSFVKEYGNAYRLKEITDFNVGGEPAAIWMFTLKRKGHPEVARTDVGFQHNGRGYAILCSSPSETIQGRLDDFVHVIDSFAWKPTH